MEYFEVTLLSERINDKGVEKKVKEIYLIGGSSFGEAELKSQLANAVDVLAISKTPYGEIINRDNGDNFYDAKIKVSFIDEQTGKDKSVYVHYLVMADDIDKAEEVMKETINKLTLDYSIDGITKKNYIEIFD